MHDAIIPPVYNKVLAGAAGRLLRRVPSLGVSSPNVSSLNGLETRPGDYRKVYSIIELVHLYGDGSKTPALGREQVAAVAGSRPDGGAWL